MPEAPVRCVIVGAGGLLAHDLARTFDLPGEIVALRGTDLDLLDAGRVAGVLRSLRPTHLVNGAAYNHVDRAEDEPAAAFALNATAVGTLADACRSLGATLVHFSTDHVFDGRQRRPYREDDVPNPLSVYARSKLAGERLARERCAATFVFRVCGLFGVGGAGARLNFVERMLAQARAGRPLRVVHDQVVGPSYTLDVARKVWRVLARGRPGLYHLTNAGATSWYDFARTIFAAAGLAPDLAPVTTAELAARAPRPPYSVLAHTALADLGEEDLRPWPQALAAYLDERATALTSSPARAGS